MIAWRSFAQMRYTDKRLFSECFGNDKVGGGGGQRVNKAARALKPILPPLSPAKNASLLALSLSQRRRTWAKDPAFPHRILVSRQVFSFPFNFDGKKMGVARTQENGEGIFSCRGGACSRTSDNPPIPQRTSKRWLSLINTAGLLRIF